MLNSKKLKLGIVLGLILSVTLAATVRADLIWEPSDSFYQKHRSECKEVYRSYFANGKDGYAAMYKSPASSEKVKLYKNGYKFNFTYSYLDKKGKEWGLAEFGEISGWIPMKEVLLKYDNISFCEEYEDEFQEYNGEYDDELVNNLLTIWEYPCSEETKAKVTANSSSFKIPYTYTDQDGNVWGLYEFQERILRVTGDENETSKWNNANGWVCLNDPDKTSFPVVNHQADTIPAIDALPSLEEVNAKSDMAFLLTGALTLVIAATAGIVIRVKMKKSN